MTEGWRYCIVGAGMLVYMFSTPKEHNLAFLSKLMLFNSSIKVIQFSILYVKGCCRVSSSTWAINFAICRLGRCTSSR